MDEITLAAGMELTRGGFLKAVYTNREYSDFVEDFVTTQTGTTEVIVQGVSAGTFSNTFITNTSDISREYEALQLIGRYRSERQVHDRRQLDLSAQERRQLRGRRHQHAGLLVGLRRLPRDPHQRARTTPSATLNDFAEHKIRVWTNYNVDIGRAGNLNFGLLGNYDSGLTFSRVGHRAASSRRSRRSSLPRLCRRLRSARTSSSASAAA